MEVHGGRAPGGGPEGDAAGSAGGGTEGGAGTGPLTFSGERLAELPGAHHGMLFRTAREGSAPPLITFLSGVTASGAVLRFALVYDRGEPVIKSLPLPAGFRPRYNYAGAVLPEEGGESVFVHGGFDCGCLDDANSLLRLRVAGVREGSPVLFSRTRLSGAVPCPRQLHAMCAVGRRGLMLFGGRDRNYRVLSDIYSLFLPTGACAKQRAALPFPLEGHGALCVVQQGAPQRLLIFGGETTREGYEAVSRLRADFLRNCGGEGTENGVGAPGDAGMAPGGSGEPGVEREERRASGARSPAGGDPRGAGSLANPLTDPLAPQVSQGGALGPASSAHSAGLANPGRPADGGLPRHPRPALRQSSSLAMLKSPALAASRTSPGATRSEAVLPGRPRGQPQSQPQVILRTRSQLQAHPPSQPRSQPNSPLQAEWLSDLVLEYDLGEGEVSVAGVLPYPVTGHALAQLPDSGGEPRVAVVCGRTPEGPVATVVEYFPRTGESRVRRPRPAGQAGEGEFAARTGCGAAVDGDLLYVFGGQAGAAALGDFWEFRVG